MLSNLFSIKDSIVSLATPPGKGGVAVIRISGKDCLSKVKEIFLPLKTSTPFNPKHGQMYYGHIVKDNMKIDNGYFVYFKNPESYTGEDTVELQMHGSPFVVKNILNIILSLGIRAAQAGEFTKRAFLNNKIDLLQAEAVSDLINARSEEEVKLAQKRKQGFLSKKLNAIKENLSDLLAEIEANLDYPDEDEVQGITIENIKKISSVAQKEIEQLLSTYEEGKLIKEGLRVIIIGKPNAGKSSLMNMMLKEDRAIVTDIAGTTRDTLEEVLNMQGYSVVITDTAGIRETKDKIELIGVEKAKEKLALANLVLLVIDGKEEAGHSKKDEHILSLIKGKKAVIIANKSDLCNADEIEKIKSLYKDFPLALVSATKEQGLKDMEDKIIEIGFRETLSLESDLSECIVTVRQKQSLEKSLDALKRIEAVKDQSDNALIASDIREAITGFTELTGEFTTQDILDKIFTKFCLGK